VVFDKNIEMINSKAEEIMKRQLEQVRNEKVGSDFYSTAEKMSQRFFSQQGSLAVKGQNSEFSSGKKALLNENNEFSFNYDAIEEAFNEVTSTNQFFAVSESHMNPPTYSYGIIFANNNR